MCSHSINNLSIYPSIYLASIIFAPSLYLYGIKIEKGIFEKKKANNNDGCKWEERVKA